MRFRKTDHGGGHKVLSRDEVGPDEARALFLGRLWAHFGPATQIDDGFAYFIEDGETGIRFEAYSGASGPSYGAAPDVPQERLLPVARALEELLAETTPADCALETSLDIDYGGGHVVIGVENGQPFEKAKKDRRRSPRSAKSYEDCLAIAKERGGPYGPSAGWQLCLDKLLPDVPEEIEIDGRTFENCIGFWFSDKNDLPVYGFDEGDGIEEIPLERIPFGKPLSAPARLWLASYERWRSGKRRR